MQPHAIFMPKSVRLTDVNYYDYCSASLDMGACAKPHMHFGRCRWLGITVDGSKSPLDRFVTHSCCVTQGQLWLSQGTLDVLVVVFGIIIWHYQSINNN